MKKPTSLLKSILLFILVFAFHLNYLSAQTFVGVASAPADNATQAGPSVTVNPTSVGTMQAGDLVIIYGEYRGTGVNIFINQGGGQDWSTPVLNNGSTQTTCIFWCTFNGTWSANPSIQVPAGNTAALSAIMYVFRPSNSSRKWAINVGVNNSTSSATTGNSITGVTTTASNTVTMAFWNVAAANTWGTLSGTGWSKTGLSAQYRNTLASSNQSHSAAYKIMAAAGATGNVAQNQSAGTSAIRTILSWCEINPTPINEISGRMNEVFLKTILSPAGFLYYPWEVTYGPDQKLWVTESRGYKAFRIDPNTGARTTILDINKGSASSELTAIEHTNFNVEFLSNQNPWPQGGFTGLALHPKFLDPVSPKNYVYVSYVKRYDSTSSTTNGGVFFTNYLVQFTYNTGTGKLESPVAICDTLPGSSDHNSQRLFIAPVGGTPYLFYAQGDMGAGQFGNAQRANKAQVSGSYQGKILRFNLENTGTGAGLDKWIPDDNPFNGGAKSAVWSLGIRNNQGFAYDTATGNLYGSSHGPFSDDEINIIQPSKNYGHPYVEGYAADGNYNGITAGAAPNMSPAHPSSCPIITSESANAAGMLNYKDPLFSAYTTPTPVSPTNYTTMSQLWNNTNGANNIWPSEGWSGLDLYSHKLIPGWKRSLVAAGLKWGRLIRLRLGPTGTTTLPSGLAYGNTGDTVTYFQSTNRYRDISFAPNGKDIYIVMDNNSATSGPGIGNPIVPACPGCLIKYTFLGYNDDGSGKSTIPTSIAVTDTSTSSYSFINTVDSATTVVINSANSNTNIWVPITGPDGNIMAEIYANGNSLDTVRSAFYKNSGPIRIKNAVHYLDRNITITPKNQPGSPVKVRLYISKAEYDSLDLDPASGVSAITDLKILKNNDACGAAIGSSTTLITPTVAQAHGSNGYVLQADIPSFSSFYFAASNIILPLQLLTFKGQLQNNATELWWETENEVNVSHFIVQRSIDGNSFSDIGIVNANGGGNKAPYNYTDVNSALLPTTVLYYRLKIVDANGSYTQSKTISIVLNKNIDVLLYPNPVKQILNIKLVGHEVNPVMVQIMDLTGRVIHSEKRMISQTSTLSIDVKHWKPQVYILKVTNSRNEVITTQKFEKM